MLKRLRLLLHAGGLVRFLISGLYCVIQMASDDYISDFGSSQTPDQRHLHKLLRKNDLTNVWGNKCDRNIDCDAVVFILVHVVFG